MSVDRIPMSKPGYEKLKAQLDAMKNDEMPRRSPSRSPQARDFGDLSENAEFDAACEAQGMLQAKIDDLQREARPGLDRRQVHHAHRPRRLRVEGQGARPRHADDEEDFILVGQARKTTTRTRSCSPAPSARAWSARKVGEVAEVSIPKGTLKLKVVDIIFD